MILNTNYNQYCIPQSTAKAAATNHLPSVRDSLKTAFPNEIPSTYDAVIAAVELRSASAFTVSLAAGVKITAVAVASEYVVKYEGSISEMVFSAETTLTQLWVKWYKGKKNSFATSFATLPAGGTISAVKDSTGRAITASPDGTYDLHKGMVYITAALTNYDSVTNTAFAVDGSGYVWVPLTPTTFTIKFAITPYGTTIVVTSADGFTMLPNADGTYTLPNSAIAGNYSYSISKTGYVVSADTFTVSSNATVTVELTHKLASIAVTTPPTKTAYAVGNLFASAGMVITATYSDAQSAPVTGYTWLPDDALAITNTIVTISYVENGVTKTATQAITVS